MIKNRTFASMISIFLLASTVFMGCSSSSDSSGSAQDPNRNGPLEVTPTSHDFGNVTEGNSAASLEVTLVNGSASDIIISDMVLADTTNFSLNISGGTLPCDTNSPTLAAEVGNCTVEVEFTPSSISTFEGTLTISSNDPVNPAIDVTLSGTYETVLGLEVIINQVETCPAAEVTAYVSVIDQGGYSLSELTEDNFAVVEDGTLMTPLENFAYISELYSPVSVALAMDYSGSITDTVGIKENMEAGAIAFIDQIRVGDEVEIIKFNHVVEVVQEFTSDKAALTAAIEASWDYGGYTRLYDATYKAVEDTSVKTDSGRRRAVIVITDGVDAPGPSNPPSNYTLTQIIDEAQEQGVPIFTIGLGDEIDPDILQQLADDTGGQYYDARTAYDIKTIYEQLAGILILNQYVLSYESGLDDTGDLFVEVSSQGVKGDDTKEITPCP